jgi:phosphoribosylamine--glycine ligase
MVEKKNGNSDGIPKKIKFLFVSNEALIGDVAWQVKKEGHDAKYYIRDKLEQDVCDGFVDKCEDWQKEVDWADVIVFDDISFGVQADKLRKQGKFVVGGSAYTDKLEDDREFGQDEMKNAGMTIIPNYNFTNFDAAIKFLTENPDRYVLKPSGKAQNEKELLFVGNEVDGRDVLEILERYKKNWGNKIKVFQLQKHVTGVEVAIGGFFNGHDFVMPININFEHKKLFPGNIGPSTGEMGTSMFWAKPNPLYIATLEKLKPKLKECGYVGYFDINTIVNAKGIHPLEATSRFGYPTINIQMEGITTPMGEFLYNLAIGKDFEIKTKRGFQVGVVIAAPPFPFKDPASFKRYSEDALIIFKKPNYNGAHIADVKLIDGEWRMAGTSGYPLIMTGSGSTMEEAQKEAYMHVENILIPNMFYRTDIGARWSQDSDRLQTWGYLF